MHPTEQQLIRHQLAGNFAVAGQQVGEQLGTGLVGGAVGLGVGKVVGLVKMGTSNTPRINAKAPLTSEGTANAKTFGANSVGAAERVLFENKFPLDAVGDPKIVPPQALKNMSGNLNYVVLEDGRLIIGKSPHTSLTSNTSVQAAGEIQFYNGKVKWLDNASGHYQPTGPQIQGIAESAFNEIGSDAVGKFQFKVWKPDPSLLRGGKWVKQ